MLKKDKKNLIEYICDRSVLERHNYADCIEKYIRCVTTKKRKYEKVYLDH